MAIRNIYFAHCKNSFGSDLENGIRAKLKTAYAVFCPNRDMVDEQADMSEYLKKAGEADAVVFTMSEPGWISRGVYSEVMAGKRAFLAVRNSSKGLTFFSLHQLEVDRPARESWIRYARIRTLAQGTESMPR